MIDKYERNQKKQKTKKQHNQKKTPTKTNNKKP